MEKILTTDVPVDTRHVERGSVSPTELGEDLFRRNLLRQALLPVLQPPTNLGCPCGLDRLLHHVHIVHIDGRSYRLRELDGLLQSPPPSPPGNGGEPKTN